MKDYIQESIVEAIEEGRIVRVSEKYALREGLPILRRKELSFLGTPEKQAVMKDMTKKERSELDRMDSLRRPLKAKNNVVASLCDNFHWYISSKRRELNWSRKQLAERIGVSEAEVKMIENGLLPKDDFVFINKIEQVFGISLRKEGLAAGGLSMSRVRITKHENNASEKTGQNKGFGIEDSDARDILGEDIEIELED